MRNRHWLQTSVALAGFAALATACNNSTSPQNKKTETVTATASVPANPTAPVTISTNASQSNASATFDAASLQTIVGAAGGGVTATMSDLAPKDYGQLGAAAQASLSSATGVEGVLDFSFPKASGNRAADLASAALIPGLPTIQLSYKVVNDGCPSSSTVTLVVFTPNGGWFEAPNTSTFTKTNNTISGSVNFPGLVFLWLISGVPHLTFGFKCPGSNLTGGIG